MATSLQFLLTSWLLCTTLMPYNAVQGVLWSYLLTSPARATQHQQLESPGPTTYARPVPKWMSDDADVDDDVSESSTARPEKHRHRHGTSSNNRLILCNDDQICGKGMFCDRHYGSCTPMKTEGDHCRKDHHCQRGFDCVFGRCRKHVRKGDRGARCKQDSECGPHMCCARQHGEFVCKSHLPIGHKCFVPSGGLDYALNEVCPCGAGLVCKNIGKSRPKEEEFNWGFWSETDNVRCTAMS